MLVGCASNSSKSNFTYSYELISIEEEDKDEVQKWLSEPSQTPISIYEINDVENEKHHFYAHSTLHSKINVQQKNDILTLTFTGDKGIGLSQEAFVKIKYNPDSINLIILKTEEAPTLYSNYLAK